MAQPEILEFASFQTTPTPVRTIRHQLVPGRYRVTPWEGAPEEFVREVEIKPGETTVIDIELP